MIIKAFISRILRNYRDKIFEYLYKDYNDNPFKVITEAINSQEYLRLANIANENKDYEFIQRIEKEFGYLPDEQFINELALSTQIAIKHSKPLYLHGYLLYGAMRKYLEVNNGLGSVNILETGTARGFSAIIMAKAIDDAMRKGKIITMDILPPNLRIYWNCIHDSEGKKTRFEVLEQWKKLTEEYIIFIQGYSDVVLNRIGLSRIHFAFLDGVHDYHSMKFELSYVSSRQSKGDVIICDDYTEEQFPGLVKAANEFLSKGEYHSEIFHSTSERTYLYCVKH